MPQVDYFLVVSCDSVNKRNAVIDSQILGEERILLLHFLSNCLVFKKKSDGLIVDLKLSCVITNQSFGTVFNLLVDEVHEHSWDLEEIFIFDSCIKL